MSTGTLKEWVADRGYGFIHPTGGGLFVFLHVRELDLNPTNSESATGSSTKSAPAEMADPERSGFAGRIDHAMLNKTRRKGERGFPGPARKRSSTRTRSGLAGHIASGPRAVCGRLHRDHIAARPDRGGADRNRKAPSG